jgi:L-threonine-O-3-phosphate decarboxylase
MRRPAHGGNLAWAAALADCSPSAIVDFSASINPLGPPESVIRAIHSQIGNLRHYPDPECGDLRLALSHFHRLPPEWILPGNGSAELLTLAGRELAQLAATILLTPAFGDYYRALRAFDADVLEFSLMESKEWAVGSSEKYISSQYISSQFSSHFISSLPTSLPIPHSPSPNSGLLLNNPHNPTGFVFSKEEILPYLNCFALVVVDEAFMDFLPPHDQQSLIDLVQDYPNLVILRSLTKFYSLPGLRLGYAITNPDRVKLWQKWRDPWSVNSLAQYAAIAAIEDTEFQQKTLSWLPGARHQLFQGLQEIQGLQPLPGRVNYLLVQSQKPCSQLQQKLLQQHKVLIRDCLSFPELGENFFRVAVLSESDNNHLLTALKESTKLIS